MKWNATFNEIVDNIEFEEGALDPPIALAEINRAIMGMNEAGTFLGKVIAEAVHNPDALHGVDDDVAETVRHLIDVTDALSAALCGCTCAECQPCECTDDDVCGSCLALYEEEEDG